MLIFSISEHLLIICWKQEQNIKCISMWHWLMNTRQRCILEEGGILISVYFYCSVVSYTISKKWRNRPRIYNLKMWPTCFPGFSNAKLEREVWRHSMIRVNGIGWRKCYGVMKKGAMVPAGRMCEVSGHNDRLHRIWLKVRGEMGRQFRLWEQSCKKARKARE